MIQISGVYAARKRIERWIRRTPLEFSQRLSEVCGGEVWLKLENYQLTGSFKLRGATNKLLLLSKDEKKSGVVTSSSGNHAQGLGYAARELGVDATVVVPENTPKIKLEAIKKYGVELIVQGSEYMDAERLARKIEKDEGKTFISPYNDVELIEGQATVGLEMIEDTPDLDMVVVPVGGGGLASGVASVFKQVSQASVVGVQSEASPVMYECIKEGFIHDIHLKDTYAEGLHGGIEKDSITFEFCRDLINDWVILKESEILETTRYMLHSHHMIVEGAAAVGPAAVMMRPDIFKGRKIGIVVSGGNLSDEILRKVA